MSRGMFGEEMQDWGSREKNSYEPGQLNYDEELLDGLVAHYLSYPSQHWQDKHIDFILEGLPFPDSEFDMNFHLSLLVQQLERKVEAYDLPGVCSYLSSVVQAAFYLGHNDFILDTGSLPYDYDYILMDLDGTEDEQLRVMVSGSAESLDCDSTYLSVTFHGTVGYAGAGAKYCDYNIPGKVNLVGSDARRSVFEVECVENIPRMVEGYWGTMPRNCSYRVRSGVSEDDISRLTMKSFFRRGNKVFTPKDDNWKEVFIL